MKNIYSIVLSFFLFNSFAQVGINTTTPSAMLHVYGTTVPGSAGGTINLINQDFSSYTVTQNHTTDTDCIGNATQGWITGTGNTNVNCTSCVGTWLYISSDAVSCGLNSTAIMNFTTAPTTTNIDISFAYRYNNFGAAPDSFRAYLYNNTTSSQVGGNLVNLTTDANTSYSGTATVVAGNSYSLRFEYQGNFDYGASVDNVLVTETGVATAGTYSFRLEDGTQADGKVLTSDVDGNGYWKTAAGGGTDSQTLSISGNNLTISNGNTVSIPSGGSYTFTNGLNEAATVVKLGGPLTGNTAITFPSNYDLTFGATTTGASTFSNILFTRPLTTTPNIGAKTLMDINYNYDYVNFGNGFSSPPSSDLTAFTDSGATSYTRDFVAGFYGGNSGGTGIAMGSIEEYVDGTAEFLFNYNVSPVADGSNSLGSSTKRWSTVYAVSGVVNTSDTNLKKDINPLNYGLNEILKLKPVSFKWKDEFTTSKEKVSDDKKVTKIGFLAQDLLKTIPEVVQTHSWQITDEKKQAEYLPNKNLGVFYSDIIPVTVKAIQEQQTQIEELREEIKLLKEAIEFLKNKG